LAGSERDQEGLEVHRWTEKGIEKLFVTTPREGFYNPRTVTVSTGGEQIFFGDYVAGLIYAYSDDAGFRRVGHKPGAEALFAAQDSVVAATRFPQTNLEIVSGRSTRALDSLRSALPHDTDRASGYISHENEIVLAADGDRLAIGYKLYDRVAVFDLKTGEQTRELAIRRPFPGYREPPLEWDGRLLGNDYEAHARRRSDWLDSFHRLERLAWVGDELYGLFFRELEDRGVWVSLERQSDGASDQPFVWNNNEQEIQLICADGRRALLARVDERPNGAIHWTLWQQNELPKP
jgi:hypothetical protein